MQILKRPPRLLRQHLQTAHSKKALFPRWHPGDCREGEPSFAPGLAMSTEGPDPCYSGDIKTIRESGAACACGKDEINIKGRIRG